MFLHYLQGCFASRKNNEQIKRYFRRRQVPVKISYYKVADRWMRYLETGDATKPLVLFVHGAPGSANAFLHFLSDPALLASAHMIAIDRPGYGYSEFGRQEISLQRQAALLQPLLLKNNASVRPLLVGHSYGGTIIARMAMDYADEVGALLMLAPAVDPRLEKIFRVSYLADVFPFRQLTPTCLRVTNQEKLAHVSELYRMLPLWPRISVPVTVVHGQKDWIAPVGNTIFLEQQLMHTSLKTLMPPGLGHLIPWEAPETVKELVVNYVRQVIFW